MACEWFVVAHGEAGEVQGPVWTFTTAECPQQILRILRVGRGSTIPEPNEYRHTKDFVVSVTAIPDPNYEFVRWNWVRGMGSVDLGIDPNVWPLPRPPVDPVTDHGMIHVRMDDDYVVTAVFEKVIYSFTLDQDPGWKMNGVWAFGKPLGQGPNMKIGNPDPNGGYTGTNVIGVNLAGCYNVQDFNEYSVVAGPLDLRGYTDVNLRFWRRLNCKEVWVWMDDELA